MRDTELRQLLMQAAHRREKMIIRSAREEKSGNGAGLHDCMFASALGVDRPGGRRLRRPEAPLLIHKSTDHADASEWRRPRSSARSPRKEKPPIAQCCRSNGMA